MARTHSKKKVRYPKANGHFSKSAYKEDARDIATRRILTLADDLILEYAQDYGRLYGSLTYAASRMGITTTLLSQLKCGSYGKYNRLGITVIQQVARKTGCTVGVLTDPLED